jgi:hypothetical protein
MLPSGYPKTAVTIYHPVPRNVPEQRGPQLQSLLKSRNGRMLGTCFDVTRDTRLLELFKFGRRLETQRCYEYVAIRGGGTEMQDGVYE